MHSIRSKMCVISHWNGDSNCVIFPTHKSDKAFKGFHGKYPYIDKFTALVGNGDAELGAEQVLGVLSSKYSSKYLKVGQSAGLTMWRKFDDMALAALDVDANLKNWQLRKVVKHFWCATGCTVSVADWREVTRGATFATVVGGIEEWHWRSTEISWVVWQVGEWKEKKSNCLQGGIKAQRMQLLLHWVPKRVLCFIA